MKPIIIKQDNGHVVIQHRDIGSLGNPHWHTAATLTPDEASEAAYALTSVATRVRSIESTFPGKSSYQIPKPDPEPEPETEPRPWWKRLFGIS